MNDITLVALSSGIDSTTVLATALRASAPSEKGCACHRDNVHVIRCVYDSVAENEEVLRFQKIASHFGIAKQNRHTIIMPRHLTSRASSVTSKFITMPKGTQDKPSNTFVPFRNATFFTQIAAYSVSFFGEDASIRVAMGMHAGDRACYPDCRAEFVDAMNDVAMLSCADASKAVKLWAPFIRRKKHDVITAGVQMGVPYGLTWSCYRDGEVHCGTCPACAERREGFRMARVEDPTTYGRVMGK